MFPMRLINSFARPLTRLKQISKISGTLRHYASAEDPRVTVSCKKDMPFPFRSGISFGNYNNNNF